jgi:anti-sigma factor RsiW
MTCHDAREQLSDLLDGALNSGERALLEGHLAGCMDCRRELERLRATVSLLRRVEPARAPVGFVERVMARTHKLPWYRRLAGSIFLPLSIKLPAQAAAMALIAVLAVFLLQRQPQLRDAARPELSTPPPRAEAPATKLDQPAPPSAPAPSKAAKTQRRKLGEPSLEQAREPEGTTREGGRPDRLASQPSGALEAKQEPSKEASGERLEKAPPPASQPVPIPRVAAPAAPAPDRPPDESRAKSRDAVEGPPRVLGPAPPAPAAKRQSEVPGLFGRLNVRNRSAAEQGLGDLLARLGGSETARRQEPGATVVEVLVPEARYAEFVRGLTALGAWTPEGQPTALPTDPPQVRVSVRISE